MKKCDYVLLPAILIIAFMFGWNLLSGLQDTQSNVQVIPLADLDAFEKRAESNQSKGEEVYLLARQWVWVGEISLQSGRDYMLHIASADIAHGFHLSKDATGESIDVLIQPGHEYLVKLRNLKPGIYPIGCTQYCGIEHNKMRAKLVVLE